MTTCRGDGVPLAAGRGEGVLNTRLLVTRGDSTPIFLHVAASMARGLGLPKSPQSSGTFRYFDAIL